MAGLKKLFVCRHPSLGLRVGSVGRDFFFILVKVSLDPRDLPFFDISLVAGRAFIVIIVITDSDKVLVNQRNEGIRFKQ